MHSRIIQMKYIISLYFVMEFPEECYKDVLPG